jgi:hypothetical protein
MKTASTLRAFRQLSYGFWQREARRHFVSELLLFALLTIVSAWPIIGIVQALSRNMH